MTTLRRRFAKAERKLIDRLLAWFGDPCQNANTWARVATVKSILREAIQLALEVERRSMLETRSTGIETVAFGIMVRVRRSAEAIGRLDTAYGYEARVLVRSILEMYFNYAWMRLDQSGQRAVRFLEFQTLEKIALMRNYPNEMRLNSYSRKLAQLEADRDDLREMFQQTDKNGKVSWSRTWATVTSVESRIIEVQAAEMPTSSSNNRFMYLLYQWFSGVTHGSPQSIGEVLSRAPKGLTAKAPHELAESRSLTSAAIALLLVLKMAASDFDLGEKISREIAQLYDEASERIQAI